jgi:hypothetical protein
VGLDVGSSDGELVGALLGLTDGELVGLNVGVAVDTVTSAFKSSSQVTSPQSPPFPTSLILVCNSVEKQLSPHAFSSNDASSSSTACSRTSCSVVSGVTFKMALYVISRTPPLSEMSVMVTLSTSSSLPVNRVRIVLSNAVTVAEDRPPKPCSSRNFLVGEP